MKSIFTSLSLMISQQPLVQNSGGNEGPGQSIYNSLTAGPLANTRLLPAVIRPCAPHDFEKIWTIINDGAGAYRGVVPADCLKDPYMAKSELEHEMKDGVVFWGYEDSGKLIGVMGIQEIRDVTLIRHAYVRMSEQRRGIGGKLLLHLRELANHTLLIGTWADAKWAIEFYEKHGFELLSPQCKDHLIPKYWKISQRQAETSVVLASTEWLRNNPGCG